MSEDPWNISPSDKERIQKRIKENSEKTFFQKHGGSLKSFIGLILFAFVVVSLRTENGRCTILPFIFSEQCSSERIVTKDEVSEGSTIYDTFVEEYDYVESEDQYFDDKKGNLFIVFSKDQISKKLYKFTGLTMECIDFYPLEYKEESDGFFYLEMDLREKHNKNCGGDPATSPRITTIELTKYPDNKTDIILDHYLCGRVYIEEYDVCMDE